MRAAAAASAAGDPRVSSFWSRILVAVVGLPVVLYLVWLGGWWVVALAVLVAVVALHEFFWIARPLRPLVLAGYTGAVLSLVGAWLGGPVWMTAGFLSTLVLAFLLKGVSQTSQSVTVAVGATVLGAAWVGLGLAHVVLLREIEPTKDGRLAVFTVLLAVFASDTIAYAVGRLIGRHRLAPTISPGKTWEGLIAGMIVAVLVPFFAMYSSDYLDVGQSLVLGAVIAVVAPIGDLFESAIKRDLGVKDSGRLLLGHGGMLDRIDAVLFAGVASYYTILALT
jgi:phosphatidate cytidylyltransferase